MDPHTLMGLIMAFTEKVNLRVDPLCQKKKGPTKQRANACHEVSGFLES